jgi:hypothetical protein
MGSLESKGLALMTHKRNACRRCGQIYDTDTMTMYDMANVPWYLCNICNEDSDVYEER